METRRFADVREPSPANGHNLTVRYRFADTVLNATRYELLRDDELVHVEPQVFDGLTYLVQHRDRVVPKTELLDAVWGSPGGARHERDDCSFLAFADDPQRAVAALEGEVFDVGVADFADSQPVEAEQRS